MADVLATLIEWPFRHRSPRESRSFMESATPALEFGICPPTSCRIALSTVSRFYCCAEELAPSEGSLMTPPTTALSIARSLVVRSPLFAATLGSHNCFFVSNIKNLFNTFYPFPAFVTIAYSVAKVTVAFLSCFCNRKTTICCLDRLWQLSL